MKRTWIQLDQEPAANWPMTLYYLGAAKAMAKLQAPFGPVALLYRGRSVRECVAQGGFTRGGLRILERFEHDPSFMRWMWRETRVRMARLTRLTARWPQKDFSGLPTTALVQAYDRWCKLALEVLSVSTYGTVLEFEEPLLSGPVFSAIEARLSPSRRKDAAALFATLTTPVGQNENRDAEEKLIVIALEHRGRETPASLRALRRWHFRYAYLRYGYSGPEKPFAETLREYREFGRKRLRVLRKERRELTGADRQTRVAQQKALRLLRADRVLTRRIAILRELAGLKRWRKKAMVRCQARAHPLLEAIAERLGVPLIAAQSLTPWEMRAVLVRGTLRRSDVRRRGQGVVVWISGMQRKTLSVLDARRVTQEIERSLRVVPITSELKGMSACPGFATGMVTILHDARDLKKFRPGDIIVSPATSPELVPAMRQAAAIVTDAGGITSHAAIVSREMQKPCVIGTKIATKVLKTGDRVEVDATKGIVKKL